jgi:hypothetical protein
MKALESIWEISVDILRRKVHKVVWHEIAKNRDYIRFVD